MYLINIIAICSVIIRDQQLQKLCMDLKPSIYFSMNITKNWSHINNVCNKANTLLGFLWRNLHHCSSNLKETTYKHLILRYPCLGYCAPVWDPYHYNLIYQLEMAQHRAAHFVHNITWTWGHHDSVTEILQ